MSFAHGVRTQRCIDTRSAGPHDRIKVTLDNGDELVFRLRHDVPNHNEKPGHQALHLDETLTLDRVYQHLIYEAFEYFSHPNVLKYHVDRKRRKLLDKSLVRFFCWSDNFRLWEVGGESFELVGWVQWPNDPTSYELNNPFSLESPLRSVECFTI